LTSSYRATRCCGRFISIPVPHGVFWGTLLHGRPRIYTYIPDSLRSFISIDDFSSLLRRNGYGKVDARGFLFGGIALHCAAKD